MSNALDGKTVVVVGASSGMGLAVTKEAAALGARVIMVSRSENKLIEAQRGVSGNSEIHAADMLDEQSINALFSHVATLDHLVITAVADELQLLSPLVDMTTAVAVRAMEKFWGAFFVTRAAIPYITQNGSLTLTSSVSIFNPSKSGLSVTSAASSAVAVFGRTLAAELAPIRVNVVAPGSVDTNVYATQSAEQRAAAAQWGREKLPVGHLGQPEELAQAYIFLMTNTYTTGVILSVDGGLSLL